MGFVANPMVLKVRTTNNHNSSYNDAYQLVLGGFPQQCFKSRYILHLRGELLVKINLDKKYITRPSINALSVHAIFGKKEKKKKNRKNEIIC